MKILGEFGQEEIAKVYVASMRYDGGHVVEFVESLQPPLPREKKWVLIVSSLFGCPMDCLMCDAGGKYHGRLQTEEILAQIDHMVLRRFPDKSIPVSKFKIQFARMGEPSFNPNVLSALEEIAVRYDAPGLMACLSTIGPESSATFFEKLIDVKQRFYPGERFQLQFSIHTTDDAKRDWLIPGKKWDFETIADFGQRFCVDGDRKITLNFALTQGLPVDPDVIAANFDPRRFIVKLTPLNPTARGMKNNLRSALDPHRPESSAKLVDRFTELGFEAILSIGEMEENKIGSNCGQFVSMVEQSDLGIKDCYETSRYRLA